MTAGLMDRLRLSESPTVWLTAAGACWVARLVSRRRSRWSTRLGYVLERLNEAREAAWERAMTAGPAGREFQQARLAEQRGDYATAVAALERAAQTSGADDPRWAVKLAELLDRAGRWADAQQVLRDCVTRHPRHAPAQRRLGEVSLALVRWGGSLVDRSDGGSPVARFEHQPDEAARVARQALERYAELEPARRASLTVLAEARRADGDREGAVELYEAALRDAQESTGRWVLEVKHRWQFQVESIYHELGRARVADPLFECVIEPDAPTPTAGPSVGLFEARATFLGLAVSGFVTSGNGAHVDILLDGEPLRRVNLSNGGFFPYFHLDIRRPTLAAFPHRATLEVRSADGVRLHAARGAERLAVSVPHGDGRLTEIIKAGGRLDKKGMISLSQEETRARQQRYLEIYSHVRDCFEQKLGRPLFLMYGTLLGYHRQGDLIADDDDFDAGYISDHADPVAVKDETKQIIVELVRAGFTVMFNRKGRLFRVQFEREPTDWFHLDVRPVWFQKGNVWVHNHASFPGSRDDFLPVVEGELRGVRVSVPRRTENFLRGHYGPGWRTPDPGFIYYSSEVDQGVRENLDRALITVSEYRELAGRIGREAGSSPPAGRLVSIGSQDLYPLEDFFP